MNRGVYALASGMIASQQSLDVITNNLANVNTSGFKGDEILFNEELERQLTNGNGAIQGKLGTGPVAKSQVTDFHEGSLTNTGNSLDFAIQGSGMFAVQNSAGQVEYTRNGSFTQDSSGNLITRDGSSVLDSSGKPIRLTPGPVVVKANGAIQDPNTRQSYSQIGIFSGTFTKTTSGLFSSPDATAQSNNASTSHLTQGSLEGSNVSAITSMTQMIQLGRNFDMAQKSIMAEDDMTQKLTSVLT